MRGHKEVKRTFLFVSLFLIIIFAFLINVNPAGAEDMGAINPSQTFDSMLLLAGQNATSSTSSTSPASFHTIWVTSYGNSTCSAEITVSDPGGATGLAWVMLFGTGGANWGNFALGPLYNKGIKTIIDIGEYLSFAIVMGGVVLSPDPESPPLSEDNPARYNIKVAQ